MDFWCIWLDLNKKLYNTYWSCLPVVFQHHPIQGTLDYGEKGSIFSCFIIISSKYRRWYWWIHSMIWCWWFYKHIILLSMTTNYWPLLLWTMHWITHLGHLSISSNFNSQFNQQQANTTSRTEISGTSTICSCSIEPSMWTVTAIIRA